MDAVDDVERFVQKGLAEGLNDVEILELLTDHGSSKDEAETILDDVKQQLSTSRKSARQVLADRAPYMLEQPDSGEQELDESPSDSSSNDDDGKDEEETVPHNFDASTNSKKQEDDSFDAFDDRVTDDEHSDDGNRDDGIFSRLTSLFSSSKGQSDEASGQGSSGTHSEELAEGENGSTDDESIEKQDWDVDALKQLAEEAIHKGLAEDEILSLFKDHGIPESYTRPLLHNTKEAHVETEQQEPHLKNIVAEERPNVSQDEAESTGQEDRSEERLDEVSSDDLTEASQSEGDDDLGFEDLYEDGSDESTGESNKSKDSSSKDKTSITETRKESGEKPRQEPATTNEGDEHVSANQLDQETLLAMAQHGIAKGFDRDELITFFDDHGVDEERAAQIIDNVLPPSDSTQNTQGRKQSEHEGRTESSEAMDAVAVQKQEQVTSSKDEDESFMGDMDKSQESLKVGRVYLTGRKPSYGRMRVQGLQDITGDEFESGGRTGFIDLSDTEEHIGEEDSTDESQQVSDDRIREQA